MGDGKGKAVYGYCPVCGAPGRARERRLGGNDICERGCVYPSAKAVGEVAEPRTQEVVHARVAGTAMESAIQAYGLPGHGGMKLLNFVHGILSMATALRGKVGQASRIEIVVGTRLHEWIRLNVDEFSRWAEVDAIRQECVSLGGLPLVISEDVHPWSFDVRSVGAPCAT